jgi:hypothetical protein
MDYDFASDPPPVRTPKDEQISLLGQALGELLGVIGVTNPDMPATGPTLLAIAGEAIERFKLCPPVLAPLLTDDELEAMSLSCKLANLLGRIIRQNGTKEQQGHDWAEAAMRVHSIQHTIMAQAASRAYPAQFRLLGGWNPDQIAEEPRADDGP